MFEIPCISLETSKLHVLYKKQCDFQMFQSEAICKGCWELTTLRVVRLDDGAELKVTDPKEQQRDVEEEEAEDEERRERVDCRR